MSVGSYRCSLCLSPHKKKNTYFNIVFHRDIMPKRHKKNLSFRFFMKKAKTIVSIQNIPNFVDTFLCMPQIISKYLRRKLILSAYT